MAYGKWAILGSRARRGRQFGQRRETMLPFDARVVELEIDPLWLSQYGIESQYLPMSILRALAQSDGVPLDKGLYRTRLYFLYGELFLPLAMALLAASLSILLLAYNTPASPLVGILVAGYMAHSATKAMLLMGQNGYMPPILAGWLVPIALFAATYGAFRIIKKPPGAVGR